MRHLLFLAAAALAVPALAADPKEETVHVVGDGETLNGIANRAGVSASAIVKANGLKEPFTLRVGQKLDIPRSAKPSVAATSSAAQESVHVVASGETLNGIANRAGVSPSALAKANGLAAPYAVRIGQKLTIPRAATGAAKAAITTAARVIPAKPKFSSVPADQETVHLVTDGETLGGIAARAKVPRVLIIEANGLQPPYDVKVGQTLKLPRTRHHTVAAGETGFAVSYKYGVPWSTIATANGIDEHAPLKAGQDLLIPTLLDPPAPTAASIAPSPQPSPSPSQGAAPSPAAAKSARFAWPLDGTVRRDFAGGKDYHNGLDISAPRGTMVRAAAPGTVKFAGNEKEQYGNLVVLDHGDGWFTAYGFLSRVTVKEGAKVAAGERVGLVGNTGKAKGDELHFEIRKNGDPIDPETQLPKAR